MNPIFLETILVCIGVFLLMAEAFLGSVRKVVFGYAAAAGVAGVFLLTFLCNPAAMDPAAAYSAYYAADSLGMFFKQFTLAATFCVILLSVEFIPTLQKNLPASSPGAGLGEFFSLPLFACAGMMWMVSATDFILIFVSLELVTITFYILVAFQRKNSASLEAGVKYLILGALSTGFIVYGITWIFGVLGTTSLPVIQEILPQLSANANTGLLFGLAMILIAIGFKIAAVPFQFWVPDVYQGAPTPMTAFLAVASKAAGFVVLLRVISPFLGIPAIGDKLLMTVGFLAGASMVLANLAAIPQTNFKRLLAYSSIAHAGFLLMAVASVGSGVAGPAITLYLAAYLIMTMLAFAVTIAVSNSTGGDNLVNFNGLGKRNPWLAASLTIAVLSLAGLPFTVGFVGKFFVFYSAIAAGLYPLVILGTLSVACGFYYYLKVIRAMYWMPVGEDADSQIPCKVSPMLTVLISALVFLTLFLGVYPGPVFDLFDLFAFESYIR